MPEIISESKFFVKVRFSREEVNAFRAKWPCCSLRNRSYWFEFDHDGDLADTDVPNEDDGDCASALSDDAWTFIQEREITAMTS
jgi:hypothetical protein